MAGSVCRRAERTDRVTTQTTALPRSRHPGSTRSPWMPSERIVFGILGFIVVLGAWEAISRLGLVKKVLLSSPSLILEAGANDIASGVIWPHLTATGVEFALGFGVALATGIPLGLAIGWFRRLRYVVDPWLAAVYATPTVALIPLVILVAGIGLTSKVIVVWLETVVVVAVSTAAGVRATEARYYDIARSFRASKRTTFLTVVLPASIPFILTGVRLGVGRALVGVIVSEFIASNVGIGFYISYNGTVFQSARVFFGIILLGLIGITLGELVRRIERRFDVWRPALA